MKETVLISTHEIEDVENLLDRALILRRGSIAEDILLEELREKGQNLTDALEEALGYNSQRYREFLAEQ